jgi:hypothetical protein
MHDLWFGNPSLSQRPETCPGHAVTLAPSPGGSEPIPLDLGLEALQTPHIPWHTVIIVMPLDHPLEPGALLRDRVMTPTHQGRFDGLQLLTHPFCDRSSLDREPLISVALAPDRPKPQERKSLWLSLSSLLPALSRKATERHQPGLDGGQGEAKGAEPFGSLLHKVRRLLLVLQPQHAIIGKARDDDIA